MLLRVMGMLFWVMNSWAKSGRKDRQGREPSFSFFQFSLLVIVLVFSLRVIPGLVRLRPDGCSGQCPSQYRTEREGLIKQENQAVCRVAFHPSYTKNRYMVVEGTIAAKDSNPAGLCTGGNNYPVILDTGASQAVFLTVRHVLDNKLTVYPRRIDAAGPAGDDQTNLNGYTLGQCLLQQLSIGDVQIVDWPGLYLENRKPVRFLGITLPLMTASDDAWGENNIILGLPLLRQFKYIEFDSVSSQAEFSYARLFEPQQEGWDSYRLFIEEDFHGNAFLFVRIHVAGVEVELQLDTGSGRGLAVGESLWNQIQNSAPDTKNIKLKQGRVFYPYIGRLACRRGIAADFKVGQRDVKNAEISVFADDCPLLAECEGMIGMQYFQDTVIVLDFERSLLWVMNKKTPGDTGG